MKLSENRPGPAVLVYAVLFLFFLQLLTDFVGGIYGYGVLGTGIPAEMAALVLFLAPFALLFFRRGLPVSALIILGELVLLCRVVEVWLPTRGQLLVAGLGMGLFLVMFPALLWDRGQKGDRRAGPLMAAGLLLAVALSVLLRTLGATMDLSNEGWFRIIALLLAAATAVPLPRVFRAIPATGQSEETQSQPIGRGKSIVLSLGIVSVFLLLYFAFTGPAVIARWTGESYWLILLVAVLALVLFAWLWAAGRRALGGLSRNWLLILTALFVLIMSLTLVIHQVPLPKDPAGFPLLDPGVSGGWIVALLAMLLLYPVLFLDFGLLVEETILGRPSMPALGLAFGTGSLFALIMILGNVFTSTWSYIDPVLEPVIRGRFWQVHLLIGLVLTLTLLAVGSKAASAVTGVPIHRALAGLVTVAGLLTLLAVYLSAPDTGAIQPSSGLRVAGYNIQQGYDILEQRGHQAQCEVLKEIDADIIALAGLVTVAGLLTLLAVYLSAPDADATQPSGGLRVAGYNIQQGYDILEQRGHQAQCEVLKEIDADIIALSETDTTRIAGANFDIVRYLAQCLDMHSYVGPKTGIGTFGYAVLSKYPIENPEVYHFFSGPELPSSTNPGQSSGGDQAAVIKAQITVDGETYNFFSNHFDGNPPIEQAQAHAKLTAGLDKVISIGDYNCTPGSDCVDEIETALVNCADLTGDVELAQDRVDHIFLSPDLTCSDFVYIQRDASDHPAVAAEIGR